MIKITDKFGLSKTELTFIQAHAEELGFDFIKYADEIEIIITPHEPAEGENFDAEFDVLIKGSSESDERGNGYFGYSYTTDLLASDIDERLYAGDNMY